MAVLSTERRKGLKSSQFALPGKGEGPQGKGAGSYPIPDASHARNALARVSQHGSSEEKSRVRAAVRRKFPGIGQSANGKGKNGNNSESRSRPGVPSTRDLRKRRNNSGGREGRITKELGRRLEARERR